MACPFRSKAGRRRIRIGVILTSLAIAAAADIAGSEERAGLVIRGEPFDRDPGWEGHSNRVAVAGAPMVVQDFGYRSSNFAGKAKGEIGGTITRASKPAYYGAKIAAKSLDDKLTASGTFAVTECHGSGSVFFGWFNAEHRGEAGRPMNSLGLQFAGEAEGPRLALRLISESNRASGIKVTPFINDRKKVKGPDNRAFDPVRPDGTRYAWTLNYDPKANEGNGRIEFTVTGNGAEPQPWEGKLIAIDVPAEVRGAGATFDHFGLMNGIKPGRAMQIHFDDLCYDGVAEDFTQDPRWDGFGNRSTYREEEQPGAHDYGFSATTNFAGGACGEVGGLMWRSGDYSYYADRVGPLSLADRLEAGGRIVLEAGSSDSTMYFGWFSSADRENAPCQSGDFVGVKIGGPTRVGHYFAPAYATTKTTPIERGGKSQRPANVAVEMGTGPVLAPKKACSWTLVYDPMAEGGRGAITATLGGESVSLAFKPGDKAKGARLDRFGFFCGNHGGNFLTVYFDDLQYTARPAP